MSELDNYQWSDFYNAVAGREPRDLLVAAVERFTHEPAARPRKAIDLGCGDGTETAYLLAKGWHVLAIDSEPAAFHHLNAKVPSLAQARLQTQVAEFEDVALSAADLIYAGFSLPFCHPQRFEALWRKIVDNITPGGRFARHLFGVNDTWANNKDMTFFSLDQARNLFSGFEVEYFREEDEDGESTIGPKHWHVFYVIAKKL